LHITVGNPLQGERRRERKERREKGEKEDKNRTVRRQKMKKDNARKTREKGGYELVSLASNPWQPNLLHIAWTETENRENREGAQRRGRERTVR
jgi:hypothetical protein